MCLMCLISRIYVFSFSCELQYCSNTMLDLYDIFLDSTSLHAQSTFAILEKMLE